MKSLFEKLPKTELHLHLGGSYPAEYLYSIADPEHKKQLEQCLEKIQSHTLSDYHECFQVFPLVSQIVNSDEKVKQGTKALCLDLQKQNIEYIEIRSGLKDFGNGLEGYLQAMLEGIELAKTANFQARVLTSLRRDDSPKTIERSVALALEYKDRGVVGLDISGDSSKGHYKNLIKEVTRAREAGLPIALHLGENRKEKHQLEELEAFQPSRIGHGALLSPEATQWVQARKIPVEVCPSSSIMAKMIDDPHNHPWLVKDHPICICTDDPLVFGSSLADELIIAAKKLGVDYVTELVKRSTSYTF